MPHFRPSSNLLRNFYSLLIVIDLINGGGFDMINSITLAWKCPPFVYKLSNWIGRIEGRLIWHHFVMIRSLSFHRLPDFTREIRSLC